MTTPTLYLVTGNKGKLREFQQILGVPIEGIEMELPELQFVDSEDVAYHKARDAANKANKPVIVDDTGVHFNGLNGLPGAYIKDFIERLKPEGLYKLLEGFEDKSCYIKSSIGFCKPGEEPKVFAGRVDGTIVPPRGTNGFGFDPVFQPEGFNKTYAEMSEEEKNKVSHRKKAIELMRKNLFF